MSDILSQILAAKRAEAAAGRAATPLAAMEAAAANADPPRGFARALQARAAPGRPALIAEFKRASPSKGVIKANADPAAQARAYAEGGAACLSVLTDGPGFAGSATDLKAARAACALPILRKDFLIDPWQVVQSRAMGADAVLVILAAVEDGLAATLIAEAGRWGMDALVEAHDEAEVARAVGLGARLIGVNARSLKSFSVSLETAAALLAGIPTGRLKVAESGVRGPADAARLGAAGADGILVGEALMRAPDPAALARQLSGLTRTLDANGEQP